MEHLAFRDKYGSLQRLLLGALFAGFTLLGLASFGLAPHVLGSWIEAGGRVLAPFPAHALMAFHVTEFFRWFGWLVALALLVFLELARLPAARRLRSAMVTASLLLFLSGIGLVCYLATLPFWVETHHGTATRLALFDPGTRR